MQFAWPATETKRTDLAKRVKAEDHRGETAICPLCNGMVRSLCFNNIWLWIHEDQKGSSHQ